MMLIKPLVIVTAETAEYIEAAKTLADRLHLPFQLGNLPPADLMLQMTKKGLQLQLLNKNSPGPVRVDFISGALAYRRLHGGGRGQLIAKAMGLSRISNPIVFDVTAGLGRDAFVLACLGCRVTMIERSPILSALLQDALDRATQYDWFSNLFLTLIEGDAKSILSHLSEKPDIIYLDPMFPVSKKSALVKKEMQVLQALLGVDDNGELLFFLAKQQAKKRVVVKRAKTAPFLADEKPDQQYFGKSTRYDVYFKGGI